MEQDLRLEFTSLFASVRSRPAVAAATGLLILAGLALAWAGWAWSALLLAAGIAISGLVDRRLPILGAVLLTQGTAGFGSLAALRIAGSVLDFRLLLTGGLVVGLGLWTLLLRPRLGRVAWLLVAFI